MSLAIKINFEVPQGTGIIFMIILKVIFCLFLEVFLPVSGAHFHCKAGLDFHQPFSLLTLAPAFHLVIPSRHSSSLSLLH